MQNPERMLQRLNPQQLEAVTSLHGPLLISAGAGTGKTTTIAARIAYGVATGAYNPAKVLALSFTAKAAAELRDRVLGLGVAAVSVRTFHSAALAQLQYFWPIHTGARLPTLETSKAKLISEAALQLGLKLDDRKLREVAAEIEWRKYRLVSIEEYGKLADRPPIDGLASDQVFMLISSYEELKVSRSIIDWEDVLTLNLGLLQAEPAALSHVHSQYRQFFVDELQDISPLQWELLLTWLGKSVDICAVGDARQAIFGFAGADPSIMHALDARFEGVAKVELQVNYRSGPRILEVAKRIDPASNLTAAKARKASGEARFISFTTPTAEAEWIAQQSLAIIDSGVQASEIAVLGRVGTNLDQILSALKAVNAPVTVKSTTYFQQPKIIDAVSMIRALQVSDNPAPTMIQVQRILRQLGWKPERPKAFDEDWERLDWLSQRLAGFPSEVSVAEFASDLEELQRVQYEPTLPAITLSTIHAAKGLEWGAVFITQLADGNLPYFRSFNDAERLAEERRLLYVAATRAKKQLFGTYSRFDSNGRALLPSRFLSGFEFERVD